MNPLANPSLQVNEISYHYDHKQSFNLKKQSFSLERGALLAVLGPSGSGKSTLLQLLAGLLKPEQGSITLEGTVIHGLPPEKRGLSMIFQKPYLLPFLSVGENVEIGLKLQGMPGKIRRSKAEAILEQVELGGFYQRSLDSLSGGQQQRVALARSLVIEPKLLLLDEPFSQLDPLLRKQMGHWLGEMKNQWNIPMIMVTHDREEALTLGDQFLILRDGEAAQSGAMESIYFRPESRWMAEFMGVDNIVEGVKVGDRVNILLGELEVHEQAVHLPDGPVEVVIRSEWLVMDPYSSIRATVEGSIFRGEQTDIRLNIQGKTLIVKQLGYSKHEQGCETGIRLTVPNVWCIPKKGG